jgi:L-fucose dehydrogenase
MELNLTGKVIVVSGGAGKPGSIGETMVQSLANEGAIPVFLDKDSRGNEYQVDLLKEGKEAFFVSTDMMNPDSITDAVATIIDKYGRIDVVINNIGLNDGVGLDASYEAFIDSIKLNLASYFQLTKCALPYLKTSKGNILNIGSKVAITGQGGTSAYAAAKGGVLALTREWAVDLIKDEIRVNALVIAESWTPAYQEWIATFDNGAEKLKEIEAQIPLEKRMTTPEEIADNALFLISDKSSHTTGQHVFVDGGYVHLDRSLLSDK